MFELKRPLGKQKSRQDGSRYSQFVTHKFLQWQWALPVGVRVPQVTDIPTMIAVGGGKGGVGKSIISANLSAMLAQAGLRVLVIDLDLGCSNLHTHFGVSMPQKTLGDFLLKERLSFRDIILPAPVQGVAFVAGGREEEWSYHLDSSRVKFTRLWEALLTSRKELNVDVVVMDLGAGTHRYTLDFFIAAHLGVVTVLPEPTSIENAYVFLRSTLWSLIENIGVRQAHPEAVADIKTALTAVGNGSIASGYVDCFRQLSSHYPEFIQFLAGSLGARMVGVVMNQVRAQNDMDIGKSMEHICQKYFGFQARYLGHLNFDESVWKSLRNRRLLAMDFPHSLIAKRLSAVASRTLNLLGLQEG